MLDKFISKICNKYARIRIYYLEILRFLLVSKKDLIALVINTSDTKSSVDDGKKIRQNVLRFKIPYFTTIRAALAAAKSLSTVQTGKALEVKSLQEYLSEK